MKEENRQYVHIAIALIVILSLLFLGRIKALVLLFSALIFGSILINQKLLGKKIPLLDKIIEKFERDEKRFVGYGSAWFVVGCLLSVVFLTDLNQIISIIWILGIGDGCSTLIGIRGKRKLIYNKKKTIEGSSALFLSTLPLYFIIGPTAIALGVVCTLVESLPIPLDDNASIPIAGIILLSLMM